MKGIIIGSGLSGLTAAALMIKEGYSVKVFEQHDKIGGAGNVVNMIIKESSL
ncbi:MAG: NAD(P)-binding protein [Promethearchaeota archaeon]